MIKRTIEISKSPARVSAKDGQLVVRLVSDAALSAAEEPAVSTIPMEDIGMVMVDQRDTTFSLSALAGIAAHGGALCVCGPDHLPAGMLLPLSTRHETVWRITAQVSTTIPTKKRLWAQVVRAKILGQAQNLLPGSRARARLLAYRKVVRSGDRENVEAQAAKLYWRHWLGDGHDFRREAEGPEPNNLLNYGYAIMRAAVARAIVSAGLVPALGIHHDHRSNAFCLADDLIEPLRPIVDRRVRELFVAGHRELIRPVKESLLSLLTKTVILPAGRNESPRRTGPLMVALHGYVASFVRCLPKMQREMRLEIPTLPKDD